MPAFLISDEEWSALVEEPGDVFLTYCAIRRVMDFGTGVAGKVRRISEQMLSEVLYVAPCRGRHESGSPSRQRIRSIVDRLIKLGALVQIGPMVFQLPLASRDSTPKRSATDEQPDQQPDQQPNSNQTNSSNNNDLGGNHQASATGSESLDFGNSNLPPVSGKARALPPLPPKGEAKPKATKFDPLTVCPVNVSPDTWADWCRHRAEIKKPLTATSCSHQAKQLANHPAPDGVIEASIANGWQGLFPERVTHGNRQDHRGVGPQSAVDRVKAAIAAREAGSAAAGQALDQADRVVREPLDGEFRRVG
ncbi:hypothetical protein PSm6_00220 [Pseudomonas solani]|uniref:Uncharacterized protein n=1 Tax=Pseudomonas solani TaxID=2731552 RepID=A0ABM7L266_9PSED|nr:hypothetical protein [Pseudomonas solani]BCD83615.1 hypothetical protein PSm6_00220 [Pseudomonas solani]